MAIDDEITCLAILKKELHYHNSKQDHTFLVRLKVIHFKPNHLQYWMTHSQNITLDSLQYIENSGQDKYCKKCCILSISTWWTQLISMKNHELT